MTTTIPSDARGYRPAHQIMEGGSLQDIDDAVAAWLVSPSGLEAVASATVQLDSGADELGVTARVRRAGHPAAMTAAILDAAMARRRARARWPDADRLLFTRRSLEQASDPAVSRWRARRFGGAGSVLDLCAGIGGDTLALGERVESVTAVDIDSGRLRLLEHNARVRGIELTALAQDALTTIRSGATWVHADPSRRDGDRRLRTLDAYRPSVPDLLRDHGDAPGCGIVLSPAVDLADPSLPAGELEFVQLGSTLTESILWIGAAAHPGVESSASLLPGEHHLQRRGPRRRLPVGPVGSFIVEVAPAAIRARLHDQIGAEIDARRVSRRRALLTTDAAPSPSPWTTVRSVEAVLGVRPKTVRAWLRASAELPVEIAVHGLSVDPVDFWRSIGRPPRGPRGRRIDLVRTDEAAIAIVSR